MQKLFKRFRKERTDAVMCASPDEGTIEQSNHVDPSNENIGGTDAEESGVMPSASETFPEAQIVNRIIVFCDQGIYRSLKDKIDFKNSVSIVFFPDHECDSRSMDAFCEEENGSRDRVVPIDECYFARYKSPFRGGYSQGPVLPPMPVIDKLRIRLYPPNASRVYEALSKAVSSITEDVCNVDIYTVDVGYSGFFIDTALLVNHILSEHEGLKKHLHVYIQTSSRYFVPGEMAAEYRRAMIEEIEYIMCPDLPSSIRHIRIGDYETVLTSDLIDSCTILNEDEPLDFTAVAEQLKSIPQLECKFTKWPYFHECDWKNIGYSGFEPEPEIINRIKEYERASRDMGLHLYRSVNEHWVI